MNCPQCGEHTRVRGVRLNKHGYPKRARYCTACKFRFFTVEVMEIDVTFEEQIDE